MVTEKPYWVRWYCVSCDKVLRYQGPYEENVGAYDRHNMEIHGDEPDYPRWRRGKGGQERQQGARGWQK